MFEGQLLGIFTVAHKGAALQGHDTIEAHAGRGLQGDRYFKGEGTFSKPGQTGQIDREVTLIEIEALQSLHREHGIELAPSQSRRNLLTRGVPLNHLVGHEFTVGAVTLRGIRLCEPCKHLEKLTQEGVLNGLVHRGGLRAQIITGGTLRIGDAIRPSVY
jgi:MOSC domain-containing protein YiiM